MWWMKTFASPASIPDGRTIRRPGGDLGGASARRSRGGSSRNGAWRVILRVSVDRSDAGPLSATRRASLQRDVSVLVVPGGGTDGDDRAGDVRGRLLLGRRAEVPGRRGRPRGHRRATKAGRPPNPTYRDVCTDETGHAEVVQVEYDPAIVSFDRLLDVFFALHDPTTLNRQGPDFGSQYRSAIFYHDEAQKAAAEAKIAALTAEGRFRRPIVTQVVPAATFYRAEEYHQRYLEKHGRASCSI